MFYMISFKTIRTWFEVSARITAVALSLALALTAFSPQPASALSFSDFFSTSYHITLSTSEVTEGQSFSAMATGTIVCKNNLPVIIDSVTIQGRIIAQPQAGGSAVTLNANYTVTITPVPTQAGQQAQVTQEIPLSFPTGSVYGTYTITGQLVDAIIQPGGLSVKDLMPQTQSIGSVNYKQAGAPVAGGGGGGSSPPVTPTPSSIPPGEPKVTLVTGYINDSTGVFLSNFRALSPDNKCILDINTGVKGVDSQGNALNHVAIAVATSSTAPPSGATLIGGVYDLGPNGSTFSPPATISLPYTLPAGSTTQQLRIAVCEPGTTTWTALEGSSVDEAAHTIKAPASHFTLFAVFGYPPPKFEISKLGINPAQSTAGQDVNISASITNSGGVSGDYTAELKIDGTTVETKMLTLGSGATSTVSFTLKPQAGNHTVDLGGLTGTFTVLAAPTPATFTISDVTVDQASSGSEVTVIGKVTNSGDVAGTFTAVLKLDGTEYGSKQVDVAAHSTKTVSFNVALAGDQPHKITLGGQDEGITVDITPVVASPTPPPKTTAAPATTFPPPITSTTSGPPNQAPPSAGWVWYAGIGAALIAGGITSFLLLRRKTPKV